MFQIFFKLCYDYCMEYIFLIAILIFSVVIHEVSHGAVAYQLGDPTAKYSGRLTLNPLKHLDPIGSVLLPLFLIIMAKISGTAVIFGWAKPVPINPYNFRDQKYGSAKVALSGPAANFSIALIFGLFLRFFPLFYSNSAFYFIFSYIVYINILLAIFNLLPLPPLDGHHIFFAFLGPAGEKVKIFLSQYGIIVILLIIFVFFDWIVYLADKIFALIVGSQF